MIATFNERVRGVDEATFTLEKASTGRDVRAFVFRRGSSDEWTLRPDHRLQTHTRYRVVLEGGRFDIRDLFGNSLFDESWTFTTRGVRFG